MSAQSEALRIAAVILGPDGLASWHREDAAAELRRQHARIEQLETVARMFADALPLDRDTTKTCYGVTNAMRDAVHSVLEQA